MRGGPPRHPGWVPLALPAAAKRLGLSQYFGQQHRLAQAVAARQHCRQRMGCRSGRLHVGPGLLRGVDECASLSGKALPFRPNRPAQLLASSRVSQGLLRPEPRGYRRSLGLHLALPEALLRPSVRRRAPARPGGRRLRRSVNCRRTAELPPRSLTCGLPLSLAHGRENGEGQKDEDTNEILQKGSPTLLPGRFPDSGRGSSACRCQPARSAC